MAGHLAHQLWPMVTAPALAPAPRPAIKPAILARLAYPGALPATTCSLWFDTGLKAAGVRWIEVVEALDQLRDAGHVRIDDGAVELAL